MRAHAAGLARAVMAAGSPCFMLHDLRQMLATFSDVVEEVFMLFTSKPGVNVKVSLEMQPALPRANPEICPCKSGRPHNPTPRALLERKVTSPICARARQGPLALLCIRVDGCEVDSGTPDFHLKRLDLRRDRSHTRPGLFERVK